MSDIRRGEGKDFKKDQQVRREVLGEISSEIARANTEPRYRNPNRDQARGDWDRSHRHADEGASRDGADEPEMTTTPRADDGD